MRCKNARCEIPGGRVVRWPSRGSKKLADEQGFFECGECRANGGVGHTGRKYCQMELRSCL